MPLRRYFSWRSIRYSVTRKHINIQQSYRMRCWNILFGYTTSLSLTYRFLLLPIVSLRLFSSSHCILSCPSSSQTQLRFSRLRRYALAFIILLLTTSPIFLIYPPSIHPDSFVFILQLVCAHRIELLITFLRLLALLLSCIALKTLAYKILALLSRHMLFLLVII